MLNSNTRWYYDPVTRLPTIRRHPKARDYPTPGEVKAMVSGREWEPPCPDHPTGTCPDDR